MSRLTKALLGLLVAVPLLFVGVMNADAARRGGYRPDHRGHPHAYYRPYYDRGAPYHGYHPRYYPPRGYPYYGYPYYGGYYGTPRYHYHHYGPHGSVHVGPLGIHW